MRILFFGIGLFSFPLYASDCIMTWINNTSVNTRVVNAELDTDKSHVFYVTGRVPDTRGQLWRIAASSGRSTGVFSPILTAYYIATPNGWITDKSGIKYRIKSVGGAFQKEPDQGSYSPSGQVTWLSYGKQEWVDNHCKGVGYSEVWGYDAVLPPTGANFAVEVSSGSAHAGSYQIKIPVRMTLLEKLDLSHSFSGGGNEVKTALLKSPVNYIILNLTIRAKCKINTKNIYIEHGVIKPEKHVSRPEIVDVYCTNDANVKMSVLGNEQSSSMLPNHTRCGNGGYCELLVSGKSVLSTKISSGETRSFSVTSTYHPESNIVGEFKGNGILRLEYN
ncbi:hypothetical protein RJL32_003852 [Salmonella enterica]|nr:hypothetical protein [Salmonella enterica]